MAKFFVRRLAWLFRRLTPAQFIGMAVAAGAVSAAVGGLGTVTLFGRFGWRALPLLAVVVIAIVAGIAALLGSLGEQQDKGTR